MSCNKERQAAAQSSRNHNEKKEVSRVWQRSIWKSTVSSEPKKWFTTLNLKVIIIGVVCTAVCFGMNRLLPEAVGTGWVFLRLAAAAGASMTAYLICCLALRLGPLKSFAATLLRRG